MRLIDTTETLLAHPGIDCHIGIDERAVPGVLKEYDLPQVRRALGKGLTVDGLQNGDQDLSSYSTPLQSLQH